MPARPVYHHHYALFGVACRYFIEEQLHAVGVDVWQNQAVEFARARIHRAICVDVFMGEHALANWAQWLGSPAAAHIRDASKARFVLKHQLDFFTLPPVLADCCKRFGEFFSTLAEPPDRFEGGACRVQVFSSRGGAANCRPRPVPRLAPTAYPAQL